MNLRNWSVKVFFAPNYTMNQEISHVYPPQNVQPSSKTLSNTWSEWWDRIWYRYYEFSVDLKWNWIIIKNRCTEWKKNVGERWEDWHFAMSYHIRNFFGSSNTSSEAGTSYFLTFQGGGVIAYLLFFLFCHIVTESVWCNRNHQSLLSRPCLIRWVKCLSVHMIIIIIFFGWHFFFWERFKSCAKYLIFLFYSFFGSTGHLKFQLPSKHALSFFLSLIIIISWAIITNLLSVLFIW